jgi:two-component system, NarL family, nitrate/nitrite sensor histidine kinase NarX
MERFQMPLFNLGGQLADRFTFLRPLVRRVKPGLSLKLIVIVIAIAFTGILASSFLLLSSLQRQFIEDMQASTKRLNTVLESSLSHAMLTHDTPMLNVMIQQAASDLGGGKIRIIDLQGTVRSSSVMDEIGIRISENDGECQVCHLGENPADRPASAIFKNQQSGVSTLLSIDPIANQPECYGCHNPQIQTLGILMTQAPMTDLNHQLQVGFRRVGLAALVTFALLVGLLVPALHRAVITPIAELSKGVAEIGAENLDYRLPLKTGDEFGRLAVAFEAMRKQLKNSRTATLQRSQELAVLYEVALITGQLSGLDQILSRTLETVIEQLGLEVGLIYLYDNIKRRYEIVASRGLSSQKLELIDQKRREPGGDLTLEVANKGETFFVADVTRDPHFFGIYENPYGRSYVNLPLKSQGKVVGTLELVSRAGKPLTERQVKILEVVGNQIGIALENARLLQQEHHMAILEERDRLAREIHDELAQALGYLNLKASITFEHMTAGEIEQAQECLTEMKQITREVYTDTREAIFNLRNTTPISSDWLATLKEYLTEYRIHYGLETQLDVEDPVLVKLPIEVILQVNRIIQEALTNTRKHAHASRAWLRFEREGQNARIVIEDDGVGFDPDQLQASDKEHFGLQIMRERAESVGGSVEFDPQIGRGTRIVVHLPGVLK